jgi:hypothetical protein
LEAAVSNEDKKKKDGEQDPATEVGNTLRNQYMGRQYNPYDPYAWSGNRIQSPYGTTPAMSPQYYGMTTGSMTNKQMRNVAGVGLLTAGLERAIKLREGSSIGAKYAARELAQARADMKAKTPAVSEAEKSRIRTERLAPVKTEIEETKADLGALVASRGGTVRDIAAAREVGIEQLSQAGLESEFLIAEQEHKNWQRAEQARDKAEARADNMVAVADKKQMEQLKYTADLIGDVSKVAMTTMAHHAAQSHKPAVDQLIAKGATWAEIEELHNAALKAKFKQGSRGYHHYLLSHWKGSKGGDKPSQEKADQVEITSKPISPPAIDASQHSPQPGQTDALLKAQRAVREAEPYRKQPIGGSGAGFPWMAGSDRQGAVTRAKLGGMPRGTLPMDKIDSLGAELAAFATASQGQQASSGRWVSYQKQDPSFGQPIQRPTVPETPPPQPMTEAQRQDLINRGLLPSSTDISDIYQPNWTTQEVRRRNNVVGWSETNPWWDQLYSRMSFTVGRDAARQIVVGLMGREGVDPRRLNPEGSASIGISPNP